MRFLNNLHVVPKSDLINSKWTIDDANQRAVFEIPMTGTGSGISTGNDINHIPPYLSYEEFEDTKGVIRTRKSKTDIQHNGQKKKDTRRVNLGTNPVISHERGNDRAVLTTSGTYPWSFVTHIFHNGRNKYQIQICVFLITPCNIPEASAYGVYIYLSSYDIPELVVLIRIALIEGCC
jgi:hypothetical protein